MVEKGFKQTEIGLIPEDWEVKKLGECLLRNPDYGINAAAVPYNENLPAYLRITDITEDGNYSNKNLVSVNNISSSSYYLNEGDLVFARTGASVGKTYLYNPKDGKLVFAGFLIRLKANEDVLLPYYLKYFTQTKLYWDWIATNSMRTGQPGINGNEYQKLLIPLPPKPEQEAIAKVLSDTDTLIEKLEQLIAKKRLIKQGAMQQLLKPKKGWEVKKLGEMANCFAGGTPSTFVKEYWGGNIIWLQSGRCQNDIIRKQQKEITITEKGLSNSAAKLIKPNSVLVAITGATCGNIGYLEFCAAANQSVVAIEPYNMINSKFLYYVFLTKRKEILSLQTGSAQGGTNLKSIKSIEIIFTSLEEQTRIAQILTDMDNEIEALERQLAKYKQIKQGMMQVLLTGKIRLVKPVKARHTLSHQHA